MARIDAATCEETLWHTRSHNIGTSIAEMPNFVEHKLTTAKYNSNEKIREYHIQSRENQKPAQILEDVLKADLDEKSFLASKTPYVKTNNDVVQPRWFNSFNNSDLGITIIVTAPVFDNIIMWNLI